MKEGIVIYKETERMRKDETKQTNKYNKINEQKKLYILKKY